MQSPVFLRFDPVSELRVRGTLSHIFNKIQLDLAVNEMVRVKPNLGEVLQKKHSNSSQQSIPVVGDMALRLEIF